MQLTQVLNAQNKVHIERESVRKLKLLGASPWRHGSKPAVSLIFDPEVRRKLIEPLTPDMVDGNNLLALTALTAPEETPCVVTGKEPPPRTHVSSDDMCSDSSESRKTDALECMWLLPRKVMWLNVWYIQVESKYKEIRHATLETGGRESAKKVGWGGGWASWTAQALFAWTRTHDEPRRSGKCGYIVCCAQHWRVCCAQRWRVRSGHRAPARFWTVGAKASHGNGFLFDACFRVFARCAKKKIFNSFTSFSHWKWFIFSTRTDSDGYLHFSTVLISNVRSTLSHFFHAQFLAYINEQLLIQT